MRFGGLEDATHGMGQTQHEIGGDGALAHAATDAVGAEILSRHGIFLFL
jgi:hypothetical protein